jgi:uncharacterized protein with GYD domain
MIKNPTDRAEAARQIVDSLGGSFESLHWMFGDYDGMAISTMPDSVSAAAVSIAVASSGAMSKAKTTELFDHDDQAAMLEAAKTALASYHPPSG